MTSKEIKKLYDDGKIEEIYKKSIKFFELIDNWSERLIGGDLLNEYELKQCIQQLNGCQIKLNPIAGCLDSMLIEYENRYQIKEEESFEKVRIQDQNTAKAKARLKASDLRRYSADFSRYVFSAQFTVTSAQSLLKRTTVEKGNKGVDFTGEVKQEQKEETKNGW